MRNLMRLFGLVVLGIMMCTPANAQFGKLLKKMGDAIDKASEVTNAIVGENNTEAAKLPDGTVQVNIEGGGMLENPLADYMDVECEGVYGRTTSPSFGEVYAVLKVKMKVPQTNLGIGGDHGNAGNTFAYDAKGTAYKQKMNIIGNYDVQEGFFVRIKLDDSRRFVDVPRTLTHLALVDYMFSTQDTKWKVVKLRDVPIQWDVEPKVHLEMSSQPPVGAPLIINPLRDVLDIQLEGVYGQTTEEGFGTIYTVLTLKPKKPFKRVAIGSNWGSSAPTLAIDQDANLYMPYKNLSDAFTFEPGKPLRVVLNDNTRYKNMSKAIRSMGVMRFCVKLDGGDHSGYIYLQNVPVTWDPEQTEE